MAVRQTAVVARDEPPAVPVPAGSGARWLEWLGRVGHVDVMTGDGELDEGQVWEATMSAHKFKLDNLVAIVDQNKYQQTGSTKEVLDLQPLRPRFEASGWYVQEVNGHDLKEVLAALHQAAKTRERPSAIIAHTIKGYPIVNVLGDPNHHGKPLTPEEAQKALAEIG